MPYYMTMQPATLRMLYRTAKQHAQTHKETTDYFVSKGMPRKVLRSAQQQDHWDAQVRLIEGVARKRVIDLAG